MCDKCSPWRVVIPEADDPGLQRVCNECNAGILAEQEQQQPKAGSSTRSIAIAAQSSGTLAGTPGSSTPVASTPVPSSTPLKGAASTPMKLGGASTTSLPPRSTSQAVPWQTHIKAVLADVPNIVNLEIAREDAEQITTRVAQMKRK